MKHIFSLILLLISFSLPAQNLLVHYDFSTSYGNTVPDISGNGNDGTLYGGAYIQEGGFLHAGFTDSDYMSVPPGVLNGLHDFTIRIKVRTMNFNSGSQSSMNTVFSASNAACINCFGAAYRYSDANWLLSFDGITYYLGGAFFCGGIGIQRHDDTLWCLSDCGDTSFIVGNDPLNVSSFILGQREHCLGGCFENKQALHGGLNNLKIGNYPVFKESAQLSDSDSFSLFPNPSSSSFQLNYTLSASAPLIITDAFGRMVKELLLDASSNSIVIPTYDLAGGVYLLQVKANEKNHTIKIVVE